MRSGLITLAMGLAGAAALFGQADLTGVWVSNIATPLQRPPALAGRATLTDAEVVELQKRADKLADNPNNDFQLGDAIFLNAFNNVGQVKNIGVTDRSWAMIPRVFENRTSLITDPADGRIPPLTAEAQARRSAGGRGGRSVPKGPEDLNPVERCITYGVPRVSGDVGAGPYSYYEIFQSPGYVVFFMEHIHEARIIPLTGNHTLPSNIHLWDGDSVGHWEGKTLVVDTTNLPAKSSFMGAGPKLHLIEKFTRVNEKTLHYEVTIDDPDTWTRPWTVMLPYQLSDEKLFEAACHEGNENVMKGMLGAGQ